MKNLLLIACSLYISTAAFSQNYWRTIPSGTNRQLLSISFGSDSVGYISGKDSLLLKTTDGGNTWSTLAFSGMAFPVPGRDIVNVNFINPLVGYAVVNNAQTRVYAGVTYKTINGGSSWTLVPSGNISTYRTFFFDEDYGYQIGSGFFSGNVVEKLSGGAWSDYHYFNINPLSCLLGIDFYDTLTGITGGHGGYVYRTFDAGVTWDTIKTNTDSTINGIRYINRRMIVAAINKSSGTLIVSDDSGSTWQTDFFSTTFLYPKMKSLVRSAKDSLISVGVSADSSKGVIYWYRSGAPRVESVFHPLTEVTMRNDSIAYAVGDSGLIITNAKQTLSAGAAASNTLLLRPYPNPSSGVFFTDMSYPHSIKVYDLAGRLVYRNSVLARRQAVDISAQAKGVYILEATLENGQKTFRKLSLK